MKLPSLFKKKEKVAVIYRLNQNTVPWPDPYNPSIPTDVIPVVKND